MKIPLPPDLPDDGPELEHLIRQYELHFAPLKKGNEAKIIWANNAKQRTKFAIVYLHGFTASHREGHPWHTSIANHFGCNLYLARLHSHGLRREDFLEGFNYPGLLKSTLDACRIGQKIGEHVLLMGTSTGGALALYAAGSLQYPVKVEAIMLASPLVHFYGYQSLLLENKFGRGLAKMIGGNDYIYNLNGDVSPEEAQIWYPCAPLSAAMALGEMIEYIMKPPLLSNVNCPVLVGYYYKNRQNHDQVVSPNAIMNMKKQLGTTDDKMRFINFPEAGNHVICNGLISKSVPALVTETIDFLENVVGIFHSPK